MRVHSILYNNIFGDNDAEVTPVPIPNTVVKLCSADDTWREAAWESRSSPELTRKDFGLCERYSSLAQSVEHAAVNRVVVGSSPTGGATNKNRVPKGTLFLFVPFYPSVLLLQQPRGLTAA